MLFRRSCLWCHQINEVHAMPSYCTDCGHRADLDRLSCDCPKCAGRRSYTTDPFTAGIYDDAPMLSVHEDDGEPD